MLHAGFLGCVRDVLPMLDLGAWGCASNEVWKRDEKNRVGSLEGIGKGGTRAHVGLDRKCEHRWGHV